MLEEGKDPKVGLVEAKVELYNGDLRFAGFAGSMIRNEVFRELGLFDHHFIIGGDNDFWVKFYWNGKFQVRYCKTTDIFHYCGGTINRGCMKEQSKILHQAYREDMMRLKYSDKFLTMTVCKMNNKRMDEEFKMGWRK
jgi:GT2 family glycosyltransferase